MCRSACAHSSGHDLFSGVYPRNVAVSRFVGRVAGLISIAAVLLTGCVAQPAAAPAVERRSPPPWDAPRDAVSYIAAAGLEPQPLDSSENSRVVAMRVTVDGAPVLIPAYVGIDRVRAQAAPVHTHDASGQVWLEGRHTDTVTLGAFFTVWGVRMTDACLGAACGGLTVTANGHQVAEPGALRLADVSTVTVAARS